jgi:CBS domain-containing protein
MENILSFLTPKMNTYYIDANSTIRQTLEKFDIYKFSVVPLIDENGVFISTISEGDILRFIKNECNFDLKMAENLFISSIKRYRPYKPLPISTPLSETIKLSLEQNFIPIVDDRGIYIGIIKRKTIIEQFFDYNKLIGDK